MKWAGKSQILFYIPSLFTFKKMLLWYSGSAYLNMLYNLTMYLEDTYAITISFSFVNLF